MRAKLRHAYDALDTASPALGSFVWRTRHGHPFSTARRHVHGHDNTVVTTGALLHHVSIDISGDRNRVVIGPRCVLNDVRIHIAGDDCSVTLGERCVFTEGGDLWVEDDGCTLEIGAGTSFVRAQLAVTEPGSRLAIGRDCMFAYDIEVRTGDSHPILDRATGQRLNPACDVAIGDHVWVAVGCTVLKGARIADGSVVGAGTLVTKPFDEADTVIAGNPAHVVRHGVRWERSRSHDPASH